MLREYLNDNWFFTKEYRPELLDTNYDISRMNQVRIPHTVAETPLHYYDESCYQLLSGYVRDLFVEDTWKDQLLLLTFEGAAHHATVYVNGQEACTHACGYTAFTVDIAPYVSYGAWNRIVVRLDSRENMNVPPFGFVIDYQTYGGIYRDVYLDVRAKNGITDVFIRTEDSLLPEKRLIVSFQTRTTIEKGIEISLWNQEKDTKLAEHFFTAKECDIDALGICTLRMDGIQGVSLWSIEEPVLYQVKIYHLDADEEDCVRIGFREAVFHSDGFYLNGQKVKLRGLNRHQSYPYVGYAMPKGPQIYDAEILKEQLGCNAVRTSHYPQAQSFIDRCDELGLLVFTEMPGWQHIGDEAWKRQAIQNVEEMVIQYRNHPSIFLWGVRINESPDDDAFYERTNLAARTLDPSRQTSGVRCIGKSNLLEDVYAYNDFLHDGQNAGVSLKKNISSDQTKGYLISEHNGHMYPTKSFDDGNHFTSQMLRHARVLEGYYQNDDIAACFGWCMFDYNTHKDFGSGDKICYHGVCDMFRNQKLVGSLYASQTEEIPVCQISSDMDIGEYPACLMQEVYGITNADSIRLYKNDVFVKEFGRDQTPFSHMPHGPILIDDFIGEAMEKQEGYSHTKSEDIKKVLMDAGRFGMNRLPLSTKLTAAKCVLFHGMKFQDAVDLYQKYIGNWGGTATTYTFEAIKDGKVVKSVKKAPATSAELELRVDRTELVEEYTYDVACIQIRAVSEYENVLRFYNEPVILETEGPIEIIGPQVINLNGGMGGTYIKTKKQSGDAKLIVKDRNGKKHSIDFHISLSQ